MTNAKGSKSARNAKPLTPADGGKPEVTTDTGTTVVLPNPADAPPLPKPMRRSSKDPKTTPATEVPAWAKRAAARDTAADSAAKPGSLRAIGNAWIESIRAAGHSVSTVSSYTNDLEVAYEFLGGNAVAGEITEKQIAAFNVSKGVMKLRTGKPKAQPTILKVRRALRLALVWAEQKGLIKKAPFAAKTPA